MILVHSSTAGQAVSLAKPFVITWKEQAGDASAVSIDLLNATAQNPLPILENIAHNLNTSSGSVNVTWPYSVPNNTATYQLYFIATESGDDIANSGFFNLTLPPGENRSEASGTVGPYGTHPSSDSSPSSTTAASHHLHGGTIAGIVVGVVVFVGLCALGAVLFFRRRHRQRADAGDEKHDKPELDATGKPRHHRNKTADTITSTELDAQDDPDKKERIDSGELEGDTQDYLRYELPSTPPPPAELADNEIPAAEMPSPDPNDAKDTPTRMGDWQLRETQSPTPRRPECVLSGRTGALSVCSGSTPLRGRDLTFAEALHEIVSQELRRNV